MENIVRSATCLLLSLLLCNVLLTVACPSLTDPNNGTITCSLGDDRIPSYEDTCNFTCNTGYELTGSDTRTCQSDGSWSGNETICRRVQCPIGDHVQISSDISGVCSNNFGLYGELCSFACDHGYQLVTDLFFFGECLADGSWTSTPTCVILNCSTSPPVSNSQLQLPCDTLYQSTCTATCDEGYTRDNITSVTYLCNVTFVRNRVDWIALDGASCQRVECPAPVNGRLECPGSRGFYQDNCTFSCNPGYELQGVSSGTCLADQSWSEGDPICVALNCSTSPPVDNSQLQLPCDTQYQSTCTVLCDQGYTRDVTNITYLCNITMDPDMVKWEIIGQASCERVDCLMLDDPGNGTVNCSLGDDGIPSYEDTCNYTCDSGFELFGSDQRMCLFDGTWSSGDVVCDIATSESDSSSSMTTTTIIIIAAAASVIVLLVIILVAACMLYKRHQNRANFKVMTRVSNILSTVDENEPMLFAENLVIQKFKKRLGTHEIESKDLQIQEPIAEGAFGIVYKGLYRKNDETIIVAIKTLKTCSSVLKIEEFIEEIAVTKTFSHPNVLSLIGACLEASSSDKMPLMVVPYMLYGDVKSFLSSKRGNKIDLTELPQDLHYNILVQICLDIAKGMAYLSSMRFIHRDLSARNCMLDENMVAKVGDFGFSRDVYISDYYRLDHSALLPVKWLAPEALFDKKFLTESDVWSFGVTCWEVFTLGLQPYPTVDPHEMADYLKTGKMLEKPSLSSDEM
ncbi:uncharacterized protein [Dysidea avara]